MKTYPFEVPVDYIVAVQITEAFCHLAEL